MQKLREKMLQQRILYEKLLESILESQNKYIKNLPENIRNSIKNYTIDSTSINEYYRGLNKSPRHQTLKDVENIDKAFEHISPIRKPIEVYRGQSIIDFDTKAVTSTSTKLEIAMSFTSTSKNCCLFKITISPGSKVLPLESFSENQGEYEILLERKGHFELLGKEEIYVESYGLIDCILLTYIPPRSFTVDNTEELKEGLKILENDKLEQDVSLLAKIIKEEMEDFGGNFDDIFVEQYNILEKRIKLSKLTPEFKELVFKKLNF